MSLTLIYLPKQIVYKIIYYSFSAITNLLKKVTDTALHAVANLSAVYASTYQFGFRLDKKRLEHSLQTLKEFGLMPLNGLDHAYKIKASDVRDLFLSNGAILKTDGDSSRLEFEPGNHRIVDLCKKMHIPYLEKQGLCEISYKAPVSQTVIYSPGSGHIFEFRKKTIANFIMTHGLDVVVYHYPGVRGARGRVDQTSIQTKVLEIVKAELKSHKASDLILYGHCIGANFMSKAIAISDKIKVIVDRSFNTTYDLTINSINRKFFRGVPYLKEALARKGQEFYSFDLKESLSMFQTQKQLVLFSSNDGFVPQTDCDPAGSFLEGKETFDLEVDHDRDLGFDSKANPVIANFLKK